MLCTQQSCRGAVAGAPAWIEEGWSRRAQSAWRSTRLSLESVVVRALVTFVLWLLVGALLSVLRRALKTKAFGPHATQGRPKAPDIQDPFSPALQKHTRAACVLKRHVGRSPLTHTLLSDLTNNTILAGTGVVGSFNVRGASFSQSERAWVRAGRDDEARGGGAVEGTVSPSDVHAFRSTKPHADRAGGPGEMPPAPGDGVEENEDETRCCFALYLHRRRETRVVGLLEAVAIEVLPLSYELATFSRVIDLCLPPLGSSKSGEQQGSSAADVVESRDGDCPGYDAQEDTVSWAVLGLSDMFNSSAAVSAQEPFRRGATTWSSGVECDGGTVPGVAVYVKGSGKFLAVASRQPSRVTLGGVGGDGAVGSAGLEQGVVPCEDGRDASGRAGGSGDVTVLDASFSALCATTPDGPPSTALSVGMGRAGMGLVEVVIPGPWDGRERQLTFWWRQCD